MNNCYNEEIMTKISMDVVDLMLNNLLEESRNTNIYNTMELSAPLDIKKENKTEAANNVSSVLEAIEVREHERSELMEHNNPSTSMMKLELEGDLFGIKYLPANTFSLKWDTPEPKLIVQLEKLKMIELNGEYILDHSYNVPGTTFNNLKYSPTNHAEAQVKMESSETITEVRKSDEYVFNEWQLKNEELDIKCEGEANENRLNYFSTDEADGLVKVEDNEMITQDGQSDQYIVNGLIIKDEEPDIKDEDGEANNSLDYSWTDQNDALVKVEDNGTINEYGFNEWIIKPEELYIKCEESESNDNSMSMDYIAQDKHEDVKNCDETGANQRLLRHTDCMLGCDPSNDQPNGKYHLEIDLLRHKSPDEVDLFKCGQCNFKTVGEASFRTHLLWHKYPEKVNIFKCNQCSYKGTKKDYLKKHLLRHKNPKEMYTFKCVQCNFETIYKTSLATHLLIHKNRAEIDMFKCDKCNFETIHKVSFRRHHFLHKNPEEVHIFKCNQCDYGTIRKGDLNKHLLRHINITIKCDQCNFQTDHKKYLETHILGHKNPKINIFKCHKCAYQTIKRYNYKQHLLRHENPDNMFKCHECNFKTIYKKSLNSHYLQHKNLEEVDMFKCDQCNYQTIYKCGLKRHLLCRHNAVYV